jgi:hypothetical protein
MPSSNIVIVDRLKRTLEEVVKKYPEAAKVYTLDLTKVQMYSQALFGSPVPLDAFQFGTRVDELLVLLRIYDPKKMVGLLI